MESSDDLHKQIAIMRQSFFDEDFLISTQFEQLEQLQDNESPNFLKEIFSSYFMDTPRKYAEIESYLHQESSGKQREDINRILYKLKGSMLNIGALRTLNEVNKMRDFFEEGNLEGFIAAFERMKIENENLRVKIYPYFQLLEQVDSSGKEDTHGLLARSFGESLTLK